MSLEESSGGIQSVDRALIILEYLADQGWSTVGEIAEQLNVHKSTASRLLATLANRGFVEQEMDRGRYRLGLSIIQLAGSIQSELRLVSLARPICKRLSESTQETVNISVLDQDEVINIDQVLGTSSIVSINWLGKRNPLTCTSTGKVLMAFLPLDEQKRLLKKPLSRCTKHSVLKFEVLERQLSVIREEGYGYTLEELELGLNAIAAPIYNTTQEVIAALSISGPSYRLTKTRIPEMAKLTKEAAFEISERLGYRV
ncbi:MAG: IclR family transcriptional regulator [Deinococcales bacterium]